MNHPQPALHRTVELEATPAQAWELVSDPARLAEWLGDSVDLDVQPGGTGAVIDDGVLKFVHVDHVDVGRRLSFSWWEPDQPEHTAQVVFEITSLPAGGSRLEITETLSARAAGHSAATQRRWEARVCLLWACTVVAALVACASGPVPGTALDDLFGALAEPTRRALFQRLLHEGPQTATVLAVDTALTRQAVVKHLQALAGAGLASAQRSGREVRYSATPDALVGVIAWLTESSRMWDRRIDRLVHRTSSAGDTSRKAQARR